MQGKFTTSAARAQSFPAKSDVVRRQSSSSSYETWIYAPYKSSATAGMAQPATFNLDMQRAQSYAVILRQATDTFRHSTTIMAGCF
jgi:hypothetical protein